MSWLAKLYQTYEAGLELEYLPVDEQLMPISHTVQNAHINVVINNQGDFLRAEVLEKTQVVLPATEKSAGRSSGLAPHPLADKIQYVAADYPNFGGKKKSGFEQYQKLLTSWCQSGFTHASAKAVLAYISKGKLVADLVEQGVMHQQDGVLLIQWQSDEVPPKLFKVLPKEKGRLDQGSALVCWTVEAKGNPASKTWLNKELQQQWIGFDASNDSEPSLCLVTGKNAPVAVNHPAKIRHSGDKAKLISANDNNGFTFRGKFLSAEQASSISFDVTQKAHNALRWLINDRKQGFRNGEQVFVSWAVTGKKVPEPTQDLLTMFSQDVDYEESADWYGEDGGQSYALKLKKLMGGYLGKDRLESHEDIIIMGIDSATPGRMGVIYYRETIAQEFIKTLTQWHADFAWPQRHKQEVESGGKKPQSKTIWPVFAPALYKICDAVYGDILKSTDTLKKNLVERLMPCIVEASPIPWDIVNYAVKRATNRAAYKDKWFWEQNLGIACALYKGYHKRTNKPNERKDYGMALEKENTSRDYLYGRLLAVAENIESFALYKAGENRITGAERMMQRFADRPSSTWKNIELSLQNYMNRLRNVSGGFVKLRKDLLDEIISLFSEQDFISDKALSGEFLLGFHCQRLKLNKKNEESTTIE